MNNNYIITHDIDWFCIISGKPIHVASAGGNLPKSVKSLKQLHDWQRKVGEIHFRSEVELNRSYISQNIIQKDYNGFDYDYFPQENDFIIELDNYGLNIIEKEYYNTFVEMAIRGFYSFDRNLHDEDNNTYHIVARTINPNRELLEMLKESGVPMIESSDINFDGNMESLNNIELVKLIDSITDPLRY